MLVLVVVFPHSITTQGLTVRLADQLMNTTTEDAADLEPEHTNMASWHRDSGSLTLGEHLSCDQPGDGPVTQGEEHHEDECGGNQEWPFRVAVLEILGYDDQYRHQQSAN